METPKEKYFAPINNFAALKEAEEKYSAPPTINDIAAFLDFWQESYNNWRKNFSPFEEKYTQEKIRVRNELIKILGIKS